MGGKELGQMNRITFFQQLKKNIRDTVTALRKDGTASMSIDNLRQVVPTPPRDLAGAPQGTNSQWLYAQLFEKTAQLVAGSFLTNRQVG
jgi:surface antigen